MKCNNIHILILILLFTFFKANSSENIEDIKNFSEGRYEFVYWIENNIQYYYLEVAEIPVFYNDSALIALNKNVNANKSVELIGWGKYKINSKSFHIG